ncbi:hypothetical protein O6H91_02G021800 [Diphasiastrum complanatum]|nr:hypothetical protein O6H91_02G021800 [Diphasiastrum complanatum]
MLKANMIERQTKTIKLEDVNAPVLHSFIRFLYSAHVSDQDLQQYSPALLLAANKYEVDLLNRTCESFMMKNISKDCVFSYLEVAFLCDSILLKNTAFDLISEDYIQYQLGEGLLNLANKYPRLIVEFCTHLIQASSRSANAT